MDTRKIGLCMIVTSIIGAFALALFEFALLNALVASVRNGNQVLIVVFASSSVLFAAAYYVSVRLLACETADYKRNVPTKQNRNESSSVLTDQRTLLQS